jgi:hypothetical protein
MGMRFSESTRFDRTFVYARWEGNAFPNRLCGSDPDSQVSARKVAPNMKRLLLSLIGTVLLNAQVLPDSAAYTVAFVDMLPASRAAAIAAIKQYRDASRKDDGFQRIDFFEQAGRPAHFCVIETWANSKDLDAMPPRRIPKTSELRSTR